MEMNSKTIELNETLKVIHQRKSVRNFTGEAVAPGQIEILLKAAMAAPSAVNQQPWEFIVVTDREVLDRMGDELPYAKMLYKAGAAIVVCAVPERAHHRMAEFAVLDATLASQNILLAAESIGLGALWTAAYPYPERMQVTRKYLNIPDEIIPLNVIPVGHPVGIDMPKYKFDKEKIHQEKWQG